MLMLPQDEVLQLDHHAEPQLQDCTLASCKPC